MQRVRLPNGRQVSFREYGDPNGLPVLFAHGNMNSAALEPCWGKTQQVTADCKVRVIAVDRSGYGESDAVVDRSYLGWAKDMDLLTDLLEVKRFVAAGYSSGGPNVLACGLKASIIGQSLFDKVIGVVLFSSDAPYKLLDKSVFQGVYHVDVDVMTEDLAKLVAHGQKTLLGNGYSQIPNPEKRAMAQADLDRATMQESLIGSWQDVMQECHDWGFDLSDVVTPVHMWHGDADDSVPMVAAHFIWDKLPKTPGSELIIVPGENHSMFRRVWAQALSKAR
eukprot:CAMPEP_0184544204 /NCGR_PEP_ID=MMETSP0199_2-20130426/3465_1 /TAXON_ID=1112570 /ORGANISM="Thraustochytrium sp., Strain LLF1b" /LENGTH=278 /DNA_ID=CAMNT_0026938349 /DNA_START=98 /DNA_END=930 /DNA_ORIENTATION=-